MKEFGLNDEGNTLVLTVQEEDANGNLVAKNISSATVRQYKIKKPDLTVVIVTATFVNTGSNGKLTYTFATGILNQVGIYDVQVFLDGAPGKGTSNSYQFRVRETN